MKTLPSNVPRKPLQLVSCKMRLSLVPLRMLESEFTSRIAAVRAGPADLPMVELNVNNAPMFSTFGLTEEEEEVEALEFLALPIASMVTHKQEIKKTKALFMYEQAFIFQEMWNLHHPVKKDQDPQFVQVRGSEFSSKHAVLMHKNTILGVKRWKLEGL